MSKIIAITSGKGGTGKTTTAAAISSCLAMLGHKTLCIDFDFRLKNLDLSLCINDTTTADIMDVANGHLDLMEACIEHKKFKGLYYIAAPGYFGSEYPDMDVLSNAFTEIEKEFEFCIIDTPAGIGRGFRLAHTYADTSIIVVTGELPAIRNAQRTAHAINVYGIKNVRLLVNRTTIKDFKWLEKTIDDIIDLVAVQLLGVIQEDKSVFRALHTETPLMLYKKKQASREFMDATKRLLGENIPLRFY